MNKQHPLRNYDIVDELTDDDILAFNKRHVRGNCKARRRIEELKEQKQIDEYFREVWDE